MHFLLWFIFIITLMSQPGYSLNVSSKFIFIYLISPNFFGCYMCSTGVGKQNHFANKFNFRVAIDDPYLLL